MPTPNEKTSVKGGIYQLPVVAAAEPTPMADAPAAPLIADTAAYCPTS